MKEVFVGSVVTVKHYRTAKIATGKESAKYVVTRLRLPRYPKEDVLGTSMILTSQGEEYIGVGGSTSLDQITEVGDRLPIEELVAMAARGLAGMTADLISCYGDEPMLWEENNT